MIEETKFNSSLHDVQVGGVILSLRSSHSKEQMEELIQNVNDRIDQKIKNNPQMSFQKALVLTCLEFAEDNFRMKELACQELAAVEKKAKSLLNLLDSPEITQMGQ